MAFPLEESSWEAGDQEGSAVGALAQTNGDLGSTLLPSMDFIVLWGFAPALNSAAPFILMGRYIYTLALGCQEKPNGVTQPQPKSTGRGREAAGKKSSLAWVKFLESTGS